MDSHLELHEHYLEILKLIYAIQADLVDLKTQVRMETQQCKEDWNDAFSRILTLEDLIRKECNK